MAAWPDPGGSDETERLAALAREVARIGTVLAELASRREAAPAVGDRRSGFAGQPGASGVSPVTAAEIRAAIRSRRLRDAEFGAGWFEEPAWDMLLDLFAAEMEGTRVSVSSLCIAAAVAPTTALRWIGKMTGAGLLIRRNDAKDRRRAFMSLTDTARAGMVHYCSVVKQAGLPIV